ncbi:hypothetical protein C1N70_12625 [Cytobacillus firmus]
MKIRPKGLKRASHIAKLHVTGSFFVKIRYFLKNPPLLCAFYSDLFVQSLNLYMLSKFTCG